MSGCAGTCCAVFYLPRTLTEFRENVDTIEDGAYILDMIVPLTPEEARERGARFGSRFEEGSPAEEHAGHHFSCRHWDEETRLCRAYAERPRMCREYPYEGACTLGKDCCFVLDPATAEERRQRLASDGGGRESNPAPSR